MKRLIIKGGQLVECQDEQYRFVGPPPQRIGDIAEIEVGDYKFVDPRKASKTHHGHVGFVAPVRHRVIWLEAEDGTRWLVDLPVRKGPQRARRKSRGQA